MFGVQQGCGVRVSDSVSSLLPSFLLLLHFPLRLEQIELNGTFHRMIHLVCRV
jgi:hypothetical protein